MLGIVFFESFNGRHQQLIHRKLLHEKLLHRKILSSESRHLLTSLWLESKTVEPYNSTAAQCGCVQERWRFSVGFGAANWGLAPSEDGFGGCPTEVRQVLRELVANFTRRKKLLRHPSPTSPCARHQFGAPSPEGASLSRSERHGAHSEDHHRRLKPSRSEMPILTSPQT